MREHERVAVGPETEEPRGERDTNAEVDGERPVLEVSKLLPWEGLEGNSAYARVKGRKLRWI